MFLAIGPDERDETHCLMIMYLESVDCSDMLDSHIIEEDSKGRLLITDSTRITEFAENAFGFPVNLISNQVEQISEDECRMIHEQLSMIPLFSKDDLQFFGKLTLEPSGDVTFADVDEKLMSSCGVYPDMYDLIEDKQSDDSVVMEDDDYNIVKIPARNIGVIKSLLAHFEPEMCSTVLCNHEYYFIYRFTTVQELNKFECVTSELMLEPFYGNEDYLAEHGSVIESADILTIFS